MAKKYLTFSCSSINSEQMGSEEDLVLTKERCRMKDDLFRNLVITRKYLISKHNYGKILEKIITNEI